MLGEFIKGAQNQIGTVTSMVGSIFDIIGAAQAKKEAKKQLELGNRQAAEQTAQTKALYSDLLGMAERTPTYQSDLSAYSTLVSEAEKQKAESQKTPLSDQLARDAARQTTSDYISSASRGARSGTDIMSLAGAAAGLESSQMRNINLDTARQMDYNTNRANQSILNSLSQMAGATTSERRAEFQSELSKSQNVLGLTREAGQADISLQDYLFQQQLARRGALADSKRAFWSGIGNTFRTFGSGMSENANAQSLIEAQGVASV